MLLNAMLSIEQVKKNNNNQYFAYCMLENNTGFETNLITFRSKILMGKCVNIF